MTFKNNDSFFMTMAIKNNLDIDAVIAAYLIMGEQFQILLNVFEGHDIHIPSRRRLSSPSLHNVFFIEDDSREYEDFDRLDEVRYKEKTYIVVSKEKKLLNHWYLPVIPKEEKNASISNH